MLRAKSLFLISGLVISLFLVTSTPAKAIFGLEVISEFFKTDNGQTKTDALYATNINSQYSLLYGCKNNDPVTSKTCGKQAGLVPNMMSTAFNLALNPPHLNQENPNYLASLIPFQQAHAARPTPDQFSQPGTIRLLPIFEFWLFVRNLAYAFAILIMVVIGFMIMFRKQIDPRTTVTATAAIPRIILALVLITFSWPIAGLVVDLGSLLTATVSNQLDVITSSSKASVSFLQRGITAGEIQDGLVHAYGTEFDLGEIALNAPVGVVIGWVTFIASLMLVFSLAMRWLQVFFLTMTAPLSFLISAIPGSEGAASGWLKSMLIAVLTFPLTYFLINFGYWLASSKPVLIGPPGFYAQAQLGGILQIAILFIAFKVPAFLEQAFDVLPSGHVQRSGPSPIDLAKKMPIIGSFF